jgi:hypothetical protein
MNEIGKLFFGRPLTSASSAASLLPLARIRWPSSSKSGTRFFVPGIV